ncbi:Uncharacterised protein [Porphyromonas cangingivalis]|uniref:Uncharacterized protein n=1 Tax=Porphyromonas cangingivalis TaxID=36874 RepID=A0A1T4M7R2_PORCN|nr:hypothetical protein SAMN02745205_01409 [Porphyromonas cangingivalis]SPY34838.1 Uncharacterised protein [Porphyromonas cangingivalis]VEJ02337.1 Uncharacterised protein [Porphyromonas cangingivalis]
MRKHTDKIRTSKSPSKILFPNNKRLKAKQIISTQLLRIKTKKCTFAGLIQGVKAQERRNY